MSAIRISLPGQPVQLLDLGPGRASGAVHDGGRLAVPAPPRRRPDETAYERVKRFRERHGGRKAVAA